MLRYYIERTFDINRMLHATKIEMGLEEMSLWKNRSFLLLWCGNSVSLLGNRFYMIALMWYVADQTGSSMALGISVLCFTVPSLVMMPFAGVLADRNVKKKILVGTDFLNGIIMLLLASIIYSNPSSLFGIYMLVILSSSFSAFFNPAVSSSIPLIVGKDNLTKANSLTQVTSNIANIAGPALAGMLIALTSMWLLFFINGVSFLISSFSEAFISIPKVDEGHTKNKFFDQFKEGIHYVWSFRELLHLVIVGGMIINFFLAPLQVFITIICKEVQEVGAQGLGFVDGAISIGALVGTLLILFKVLKDKIKMAILGLTLEGFALLISGLLIHSYLAMIAFALILGFGVSLASVGISTLFQTIVPDEKRGRASSVLNMMSTFIVPVGTLFGSFIITMVPMEWFLVISGVLVSIAGLSLIRPFLGKEKINREASVNA